MSEKNNILWQQNLADFLIELDSTAVERDHQGGHPAYERQLIRDYGLLPLNIEQELGGGGLSWSQISQIIQQIAAVDSAIGHILAFHYLQLLTIKLYGSAEQYIALHKKTLQENIFWGNALNPNDKRAVVEEVADGIIVNGAKSYSSGSVGSDWLVISAWDEARQDFWVAVTPSDTAGVQIKQDWDSFGQKQTDSGTVLFENVFIPNQDVLFTPKNDIKFSKNLRALLAQSVLVNLYVGIAVGVLDKGKKLLKEGKKAWFLSNSQLAIEDSFNQYRFAQLHVQVKAAKVLADAAFKQIDQLLLDVAELTETERGELAIQLIEAKIAAHQAAIAATTDIFEILGASATTNKLGLDRFWRNARVHTLHDPIDYKFKDLGNYLLTGAYPTPTAYS